MRRLKLQLTVLLTAMTLLQGCASQAVVSSCPPLKAYSEAFSKGLADELVTAGKLTVEALSDYYVLRRQVEACQK